MNSTRCSCDSEDGRLLQTLEGHTCSVSSVSFSPQGDKIVSGSYDETVRVWSTEDDYSQPELVVWVDANHAPLWNISGPRTNEQAKEKTMGINICNTYQCICNTYV